MKKNSIDCHKEGKKGEEKRFHNFLYYIQEVVDGILLTHVNF